MRIGGQSSPAFSENNSIWLRHVAPLPRGCKQRRPKESCEFAEDERRQTAKGMTRIKGPWQESNRGQCSYMSGLLALVHQISSSLFFLFASLAIDSCTVDCARLLLAVVLILFICTFFIVLGKLSLKWLMDQVKTKRVDVSAEAAGHSYSKGQLNLPLNARGQLVSHPWSVSSPENNH